MKKWIVCLLCIVLILSLSPAVSAAQPRVVDNAGILTDSEESALESRAAQIAEKYGMDVVLLTVKSLDGKTSNAYADDFYDNNGYGIGEQYSGVLFLFTTDDPEVAISTCGDAIEALTDSEIEAVFDEVSWHFSDKAYYDGFQSVLDQIEHYYEAHYDRTHLSVMEIILRVLLALGIGAAGGGIGLLVLRSGMNTVKAQHGAQSYVKQNSFDLVRHQDMFLYSRVSKVPRSDGSGGRGGSSTHHSSSGRTHGGGSRRL